MLSSLHCPTVLNPPWKRSRWLLWPSGNRSSISIPAETSPWSPGNGWNQEEGSSFPSNVNMPFMFLLPWLFPEGCAWAGCSAHRSTSQPQKCSLWPDDIEMTTGIYRACVSSPRSCGHRWWNQDQTPVYLTSKPLFLQLSSNICSVDFHTPDFEGPYPWRWHPGP